MLLLRFYDAKLAQASYLVGCQATGEALVVDPNRDIDRYLEAANAEGLRVTHVTETHIHADFVSGSRELAHRAGARLYLSDAGGADWRYGYATAVGAELLNQGSRFRIGNVAVEVLHTPGHTPEHVVLLITDTAAATEPMGAFTGDFIFVGDVGRPDLLERAAHVADSMEAAARELFRSLQRFGELPDYLQIWPGHGAGSACGKALGAVPQSTLGYERRFNWAFGVREEDEFVRSVLAGQPDPPRYFAQMKRINRDGPRILGGVHRPARLTIEQLARVLADGVPVVDTRPAAEFTLGAVPGTISIPLNRSFTTWAGWLLPYDRDFYLVIDDRRSLAVDEVLRDLAGIGLDRVAGYFGSDVVETWRSSRGQLQAIPILRTEEVAGRLRHNGGVLLDVRGEGEWAAGHIPGSLNIPVGHLDERLAEIPRDRPVLVHCQTGNRAAIAASLLRARGLSQVLHYAGGFAEWQAAGHPVEQPAE
jgi:hydroxyacylglutathione hydrolase